jgi:hypothetical protein
MDMISIGKHLNFLIFLDDYLGLTFAYPMQKNFSNAAEDFPNNPGTKSQEFLSNQGTVLQDISNHAPQLKETVEENPDQHEYDALYAQDCETTQKSFGDCWSSSGRQLYAS